MPRNDPIPNRLVVAIGGNAIHPEGIRGTSQEQVDIAAATAKALLPLTRLDNQLVITHGNGPVIGKILMRQVLAADQVAPMSLDICVAHSQGGIAYLLMQAIENALREDGNSRHVASLLTQVEVDPEDPAFLAPSKPVGPFFTEAQAKRVGAEFDWLMKEDSGRGWRHVVASPEPKHICDISLIEELSSRGSVVTAGGGGGIPVVRGPNGVRHGISAVIDKDLTSALMANVLGIEHLMILTAVPKVAIHFGTPRQQELDQVSLSELKALHAEGHFPPGSMGPKVEAAIRFLEGGGKKAIVCDLEMVMPALRGETGTHIVAD